MKSCPETSWLRFSLSSIGRVNLFKMRDVEQSFMETGLNVDRVLHGDTKNPETFSSLASASILATLANVKDYFYTLHNETTTVASFCVKCR